MKLDTIWQYPVKSMIGGTVESAELDEVGIVGDRTWAVRDEDAGVIANTRKLGGLMRFAARYGDGGSVTITLPGARTVASTDPDVDSVLSARSACGSDPLPSSSTSTVGHRSAMAT